MKHLITYLLIIFTGVMMLIGCQPSGRKQKYQESAIEQVNQIFIDSMKKRVSVAETRIMARIDSLAENQKKQTIIFSSYKPVYEKINNAPDGDQFAITEELLAKHRSNPLKRDQ